MAPTCPVSEFRQESKLLCDAGVTAVTGFAGLEPRICKAASDASPLTVEIVGARDDEQNSDTTECARSTH
jgi:hypothetical protein